jgi:hypothetical protein
MKARGHLMIVDDVYLDYEKETVEQFSTQTSQKGREKERYIRIIKSPLATG